MFFMFVCEISINEENVIVCNTIAINQSGSYPSIYSLGWIHAYWRVYEVLQPRVGQLKTGGYVVDTAGLAHPRS